MIQEAPPVALSAASSLPLVGREAERRTLSQALREAKGGHGSTWVLEGAGGIGKTRLATWVEEEAERSGFRVRWGRGLRESMAPFFPWQQVFRPDLRLEPGRAALRGDVGDLPIALFLDELGGAGLRERLGEWSGSAPTLLLTRERPDAVRSKTPGLSRASVRWVSREEGGEALSPAHLDLIAEHCGRHLRAASGGVVVLEGLEYLVALNSFPAVLQLLQFLRDVAAETEGHLLVTARPATFERRQLALLETLGSVGWEARAVGAAPRPQGEVDTARAPALVFLDYLERLEGEALQGPVLILLDDLQWADPVSVSAFQFLARNLRSLPVLLLATVRLGEDLAPEEANAPNLAEVEAQMDKERILAHLRLGPLPKDEALQVVRELLGAPLENGTREEDLQAFVERSAGNPYWILITTRMMAEEGWLHRRPGDRGWAISEGVDLPKVLPHSVRSTVHRRLTLLCPEERELLELGAVQGREFELAIVADLLHRPRSEVEDRARRIHEDHQIIGIPTGNEGRVAFTHALTWEAILAEQEPTLVRERAALLAAWWARERPHEAAEVARHYHEAGDAERGLPWVEKALGTAFDQRANRAAERLARWRLDLQEALAIPLDTRARQGLEAVHQLVQIGDYPAALRLSEALSALPLGVPLRWEVAIQEVFNGGQSNPRRARARLDELSREMEGHPEEVSDTLLFELRLATCSVLIREGGFVKLKEVVTAALAQPMARADARGFCRAVYLWCYASATLGENQGVEARLSEGIAVARKEGLERQEAQLLGALSELEAQTGHFREACSTYERAVALFLRLGDGTNASIMLGNLNGSLSELEAWDAASKAAREAEELGRKFGSVTGRTWAILGDGSTLAFQGKWAEAERRLKEGLAMAQEGGFEGAMIAFSPYLAQAQGHLGHRQAAWGTLAEVEAHLTGTQGEMRVMFHRIRAELRLLDDDLSGSRKELQEAQSWLKGDGAYGERIRVWKAIARLEAVAGDPSGAAEAWARMNEAREKIGLPDLPAG